MIETGVNWRPHASLEAGIIAPPFYLIVTLQTQGPVFSDLLIFPENF